MKVTILSVWLLLSPLISMAADNSLGEKLKPLIDSHKGKVAVAVKHLDRGETFTHDADTVMPTASLIKTAIMVEAYAQADEKKIDLSKMVTVSKSDKVPGSGILTSHFSDGATFSLRDAVRLMIVYSDNTATNLVLDAVGMKNVNSRMSSLGFKETRINAKVYKPETRLDQERGRKYGLGSTTANESIGLLEQVHRGKAASTEACKAMFDHLKACDDKEKMTRFLPPGTVVAHKTGSVNDSRTDAGIIFIPDAADKKKSHAVLLCVLTNDNEDKSWVIDNAAQVLIAKIAKTVYEHYSKK